MNEPYLYYFIDVDKWFKELYWINKHWFKVRYGLSEEQLKKISCKIQEMSVKMSEIRALLYVNPAGSGTDSQTEEQPKPGPADSNKG